MEVIFETGEDRQLSPRTGWTRKHWLELADKMIAAIQPYLTPGKGGLALPNPTRWMDEYLPEPEKMRTFYWMEGYTRTRLLLACWMMGAGRTTLTSNGRSVDIRDQFVEGLLSASDPKHPEYIGDRYGNNQWIAETSSVALAIYIARELVWDSMSPGEREQVSDWLRLATGHKIAHNNWYLFVANTQCVLKALGEKYDQDELDRYLQQVKNFYIGGGWFMDGDHERGYSIDQYNAWGFHHFLPAYVYMNVLDPTWKDWIVERLKEYVSSYKHFFGGNGAFPMWGRSWAYRPAVVAPFNWAEILGVSPLQPGESRRLVSGVMKYYVENGYFQADMTPTMGYAGENLKLIEPYSQYGSPYWGSAAFLNLLLPDSHPFWRDREEPLTVEQESYCVPEPDIGLLVTGNHETGEVQIINHRSWHQREGAKTRYAKKYTNFSYSSHFGIDLRRDDNGYNCDNMFSVSPDGKKYSQRIIPFYIGLDKNYGASYHYPLAGFPFGAPEDAKAFSIDFKTEAEEDQSVKITTQLYLKEFCQVRVHTLETKRKLAAVREGGFALNYFGKLAEAVIDEDSVAFWNGERGSFIKNLFGYAGPSGLEVLLDNTENHHTLGGKSVTPTLIGGELKPGRHVFVSLSGTWFGGKNEVTEKLGLIRKINVSQDQVKLWFSEGTDYTFKI
ncbi:MAG: DUF2264 domain-containing protein [Fidelibacterota bacterium]|nr:MAG: DUF2264 domain-containing protein [Candidatus Neomarinimicrobiota bacterium]